MKITLEFDTEKDVGYKAALNAHELHIGIEEFKESLRRIHKYENLSEETFEVVDKIFVNFYDYLGDVLAICEDE